MAASSGPPRAKNSSKSSWLGWRRCLNEGLVGGEGFAIDASLIKAGANRQKGIEREKGLPPDSAGRSVEEYLAVLDDGAFGAASEVKPS